MEHGGGSQPGQRGSCLHGVLTELLNLRGVPGGITVDYSRDLSQLLHTDPKPHSPMEQAAVFLRTAGWQQDLRALRTQGVLGMLLGLLCTLYLVVMVAPEIEIVSAQAWLLLLSAAAMVIGVMLQPWMAGLARARMAQRLGTAGLYELWLLCLTRGPEFFRELQQQQLPWTMTLLGAKPYPATLRPAVRFMVTGIEWFTPQPRLSQNLNWVRSSISFIPLCFILASVYFSVSSGHSSFALLLLGILLISEVCGMLLLWRAEAWVKAADKQRILLSYLIEHLYAQLQHDDMDNSEARVAAPAPHPRYTPADG